MATLSSMARHEHILSALQKDGKVSVVDMSDQMRVSSVTIRKDLELMERRGFLRRIRGGAVESRTARFEMTMTEDSRSLIAEKEAIGRAAAAMVRDGQTVMVDAGSTNLSFASALSQSLQDVVLVTNSIAIALALENHAGVSTFLTGGRVRRSQRSLVAPFGNLLIERINADVAFLSCAGIDSERGLTNSNWEETEMKLAMAASSARAVYMADHTKFGHVGSALIVSIEEAGTLVTDAAAPASLLRDFEARGLEIVVAKSTSD
ncbi:DeoR/GlpR family DNA-binding transcription regulator [Jannaschia sp. 2305UL9-9]|uniref:DeoR/GlpR family DNA-binding transcription regulator n=1 Tax=Jannaschia sp. 2305UL9-9 TaxID=3121638 RepID=UPI003527D4ED